MKKVLLILSALFLVVALTQVSYAQKSAVKMNEIQSRGVAGDLDWIELYNSSNAPVNISGYRIYDNGGQGGTKPKKPFPAGTIIPAKGFYVIITDTASFAGDLSGFGLSSSGETVWLEDTTTHTIIDSVTFGATANATQTYGRGPDGGAWMVLNTVTRGQSNGSIVMNEIYSRGVAGNLDWIEIYNSVSAPVNISRYKIYDNGGQAGTKPKKPFPAGTIIPSKGFYVIITDTASFTGDLSGFGLSSGGETVWLEDTVTATLADSVAFAAMTETQTYGRYPDGGAWRLLSPITRGTSNNTATSVGASQDMPTSFALLQNYPNPFNPSTAIAFEIPKREHVKLSVYNTMGQLVRTLMNTERPAGSHTVLWNGKDNQGREVASGVYFYELVTGSFSKTAKMLLVR